MSRRRIPGERTSRPTPIPTFQTQSASPNDFTEPIIKHVRTISHSRPNEIVNEFIIFIFTLIAASSQFVHLYRSVWWFEDSFQSSTVVSLKTKFNNFSPRLTIFLSITEFLSNRHQFGSVYICDDWKKILLLSSCESA